MKLKVRQVVLFFLVFVVSLIVWYVYPQSGNRIFYQNYRYLSEIRKSGPYVIKRLAKADLDYVPCLLMGNRADVDAVYLAPDGKSVWYLSIADIKQSKGGILYEGSSWRQIDFEGNVLQCLPENELPPEGGHFLEDRLQFKKEDRNDTNGILRVSHFKRNHFNWSVLNPFSDYVLSREEHSSKTYWDGVAYLKLIMPEGNVDFKTETSNTDYGYGFGAKLFEIPTVFAKNQSMLLTLTNTGLSGKDQGIYLIYKK